MEHNKILMNFDFINKNSKVGINPTLFQTTDYEILKELFSPSHTNVYKIGDVIEIKAVKIKIVDILIKVFPETQDKGLVKNDINGQQDVGIPSDYNSKAIIYYEEV
jgi:hypothetical protein